MALLKLQADCSVVNVPCNQEEPIDLGIRIVDSSTNEESTLSRIQNSKPTIKIKGNEFIERITTDYAGKFTATVEKNWEAVMKQATVNITATISYFDPALNLVVEDGESTVSIQVQQEPYIEDIEPPAPPALPSNEDSEFKEEYMTNKELCKELLKEIEKIFEKFGQDLLQLGQDFIDQWTNKIYDVLCGVSNLVNQEIAIRKAKIYEIADNCLKIIKFNDKISVELRRASNNRDQTMIDIWTEKIKDLVKENDDIANDLVNNHTMTQSGFVELSNWENQTQEFIIKQMEDETLTNFCNSYFSDKEDSLIKQLQNTFNAANIGDLISQKFRELKHDGLVLINGVKEMVSSAITSITEPMGAVIATPVGPAVCTTNIMQIRGTVKRVQAQAIALVPVITAMIDAAIFLGLPASLIQCLTGLATTLTLVKSIPIP